MLTSASYCAIKVHLGFSKPDLFNHCLLLQTPRVCMDTLFPQHWQCPGTPCSSLLVAALVFGLLLCLGWPQAHDGGTLRPVPQRLWTSSHGAGYKKRCFGLC